MELPQTLWGFALIKLVGSGMVREQAKSCTILQARVPDTRAEAGLDPAPSVW